MLTPEFVFRNYETAGVPDSGKHDPKKSEIIQLLNLLFGVSRGGWVVARTQADLLAITPDDEADGGVVLNDPDPTRNGYYSRVAAAWVRQRGFPDTFAKITLAGSGTAQTGTVNTGVNPSSIEVFFAKVVTPNTGPLTLAVDGGTALPVINLAGNPLAAGEWNGMVIFYLNEADQYQLLIDAGAAASATAAEAAAEAAEAAAALASGATGALNFANVAALFADEALSYASGDDLVLVSPGNIVTAAGFRYVVATESASDHNAITAGGVKLYWVDQATYGLDYFDLAHESSPTTDQSAKVQAMLDFLGGKTSIVSGSATVGISAPVYLPGNATAFIPNLTLFLNADFDGSTGISNFAVIAEAISDTHIHGLKMDGNEDALGGLYPINVSAFDYRGVLIVRGCENVFLYDWVVENVPGNAYLAYGGGTEPSPDRCGFIRCVSRNCGLGPAQEKWQEGTTYLAPQKIVYDNCIVDDCNFGIYLAGGSALVTGGRYNSLRNETLTLYVGDAMDVGDKTEYTLIGVDFTHANDTAGDLGTIHNIQANAAVVSTYGDQSPLKITMIDCSFTHEGAGQHLVIEEGPDVTMVRPRYSGGLVQVTHRGNTLGPAGSYNGGDVHLIDPVFEDWGGVLTYAVSNNRKMRIDGAVWREPSAADMDCISLGADSVTVLTDPVFSTEEAAQHPRHGVSASFQVAEFACYGAVDRGLTGAMFSVAASDSGNWQVSRSIPANAIDQTASRKASVAPTYAAVAGTLVLDSLPALTTGKVRLGWVRLNSGTWQEVYATSS